MSRKMANLRFSAPIIIALFLMGMGFFTASTSVIASPGPQEWYLSNDNSTFAGKTMTRAYNSVTGSIDINAGAIQYWLTDIPAAVDVKFPDGAWIIQLKTDTYWGDSLSNKCIMTVGEWSTSGSIFSPFPTSAIDSLTYDNGTHILRIELQLSTETVHQNNYIALRIENIDSTLHTVYTDGESSIKSPNSDPGYPTPEIHPNSVASIISSRSTVVSGFHLTLFVTDTNTGDVPITDPSMDLIADRGSFHINLTKSSPSYSTGDSNNDGIFDPGETWRWAVTQVTVTGTTVFTATGHGSDPYGFDVTAPEFQTEQVTVTVDIYPAVAASIQLGMAILIGGLAIGTALLISRRIRHSL